MNGAGARFIDRIAELPTYGPASMQAMKRVDFNALMKCSYEERQRQLREIGVDLEEWRKDPSGGYAKTIYQKVQEGAMALVADEIVWWFAEHVDNSNLSICDCPNAAPPWPSFWVEFDTRRSRNGVLLGRRTGVYVESEDVFTWSLERRLTDPPPPGVRFILRLNLLYANDGETDLIGKWPAVINVARDGAIVGDITHETPEGPKPPEDLERFLIGLALTAISFAHCRNVRAIKGGIDRNLDRARVKRGKPPLVRYHTLQIDGMKEVLRSEGGSETVGIKKALHICKGHFKHYKPGAPLFGHYVGSVWCPQHRRGSAEHGVVLKDYAVKDSGLRAGRQNSESALETNASRREQT